MFKKVYVKILKSKEKTGFIAASPVHPAKHRPFARYIRICLALLLSLLITAAPLSFNKHLYVQSAGSTLFFFSDNIYELKNSIIYNDGTYYLEADEFSKLTNIKHSIDERQQSVNIEINDMIGNFVIRTEQSSSTITQLKRILPEIISGKLFFPLNFFEYFYDFIIKYNSGDGIIIMLPGENFTSSELSRFVNLQYGYSVIIPGDITINAGQSDYNYDGSLLNLSASDGSYTARISCDRLNALTLTMMRSYFNDFLSTEEELFRKVGDYKKSYYSAMESFYTIEYLYGDSITNGSSAGIGNKAFKLFTDTSQILYGQESHVIIYDTFQNEGNTSSETTHAAFTVPSYKDMTYYTIEFTTETGRFDKNMAYSMNRLLKSIVISSLDIQKDDVSLLSDQSLISYAETGIYPDLPLSAPKYMTVIDSNHGYSVTVPDFALPFHMNSITSTYDYRSYRIAANCTLAISSWPLQQSAADKAESIKDLYGDRITVKDSGTRNISGNECYYIVYELKGAAGVSDITGGLPSEINEYIFISSGRMLSLKLTCTGSPPSAAILAEYEKIINSLRFIPPAPLTGSDVPAAASLNRLSDTASFSSSYNLAYPKEWNAVRESGTEGSPFGSWLLINNDFSASLEIRTFETQIPEDAPSSAAHDIALYLAGYSGSAIPRYLPGSYIQPLAGRKSILLNSINYTFNDMQYVVRLAGFVDNTGRNRHAYMMDIIGDGRICSLFISLSSFAAEEGVPSTAVTGNAIRTISSTFALNRQGGSSSGSDSEKAAITAALKTHVQKYFAAGAEITSIMFPGTFAGEVIAAIDNIAEPAYYRFLVTGDSPLVTIVSKLTKMDAVQKAASIITDRYEGTDIADIAFDMYEMSIYITARNSGAYSRKKYSINVDITGSTPLVGIRRMAESGNLAELCEIYIENYTGSYTSPDISGDTGPDGVYRTSDNSTSYIVMYAGSEAVKGYYIFSVNETDNNIISAKYVNLGSIYSEIENKYGSDMGFKFINCFSEPTDRFAMTAYYMYGNELLIRKDSYRVRFSAEKATMETVRIN